MYFPVHFAKFLRVTFLQNIFEQQLLSSVCIFDHDRVFTSRSFQKQPPEVFFRNFSRNFTKFTGKHLCQSLFFNKVAGLRPEITLIVRRTCDKNESFRYFEAQKLNLQNMSFSILTYHSPLIMIQELQA